MFGGGLAKDYLSRGGDEQWSYGAPDYNLRDKIVGFLRGMKLQPTEPLTLFGVDKMPGMNEDHYKPTTLNYGEIKKYNPSLAEKYRGGEITDREAQEIINNGYIAEDKRKAELEGRNK